MKSYHSKVAAIVIACTTLLFGCYDKVGPLVLLYIVLLGDDADETAEYTIPEDCARPVHPIENTYTAEEAASSIMRSIAYTLHRVDYGTYNEEILSDPNGGTIKITGIISYTGQESCGENCTTNYHDTEIIAELSEYPNVLSQYSDTEPAKVTGVINYSDTTGTEYTEYKTTYFGHVTISDNGTDVLYDATWIDNYNCDSQESGILDTFKSIHASASDSLTKGALKDLYDEPIGTLTTANGTFDF